ncbi:hypothetical protein KIPB_007530, partial [Kipferlia bialata]
TPSKRPAEPTEEADSTLGSNDGETVASTEPKEGETEVDDDVEIGDELDVMLHIFRFWEHPDTLTTRAGVDHFTADFQAFADLMGETGCEDLFDEWGELEQEDEEKERAIGIPELYQNIKERYSLDEAGQQEAECAVQSIVREYVREEARVDAERERRLRERIERGDGFTEGVDDREVEIFLAVFRHWEYQVDMPTVALTREEVQEALAVGPPSMTPVERINAKVAQKLGLEAYPKYEPRAGVQHLTEDFQAFLETDMVGEFQTFLGTRMGEQFQKVTQAQRDRSVAALIRDMQARYSVTGDDADDAVKAVAGLIKQHVVAEYEREKNAPPTEPEPESDAPDGSYASEDSVAVESSDNDEPYYNTYSEDEREQERYAMMGEGEGETDEDEGEESTESEEEEDSMEVEQPVEDEPEAVHQGTEASHLPIEVYGQPFPTLPSLVAYVIDVSGCVWEPEDCGVLVCIHPGCNCHIRYTVEEDGFCLVRPTDTPTLSPTPLGGHSPSCPSGADCNRRGDYVYHPMNTSTVSKGVFSPWGAVSCPLPDDRVFALCLSDTASECGIVSVTDLAAVSNGTPINQLLVSEGVSVPKGMGKGVRCTYSAGRVFVFGCEIEGEESPEVKAREDENDRVWALEGRVRVNPRSLDITPKRNRLWVYDLGLSEWEECVPDDLDQDKGLWPPAFSTLQVSMAPYQDRVWVIGKEAQGKYGSGSTKVWSLDPDTYQWREEREVVPETFTCSTVCESNGTLHIFGLPEEERHGYQRSGVKVHYLTYSSSSGLVRHDNTGPFGWFGPSSMIAVGEYLVGVHGNLRFMGQDYGPSVFDTVQAVWVADMVLGNRERDVRKTIRNLTPLGHLCLLEDSQEIIRLNPSLCYPGTEGGPLRWALPKTPILHSAGQMYH